MAMRVRGTLLHCYQHSLMLKGPDQYTVLITTLSITSDLHTRNSWCLSRAALQVPSYYRRSAPLSLRFSQAASLHFFQPRPVDCLAALRQARFFSLIMSDSGVGLISNRPVIMVCTKRSGAIALVSGSANMTLVSIQRG